MVNEVIDKSKEKEVNLDTKKGKKKDEKKEVEELSEEDQELLNKLESIVTKLREEDDNSVLKETLIQLHTIIKTSTSSMTSVPKPLKYLARYFKDLDSLYTVYIEQNRNEAAVLLADVLSILGMSCGSADERVALKFRLLGSKEDIVSWGHEYIRTLSHEVGQAFSLNRDRSMDFEESGEDQEEKDTVETTLKDLYFISMQIVPFFLKHNAEADAVDLLFEIENVHRIVAMVDEDNYKRVCLYIISCVPLLPPPDDKEFLKTAYAIYTRFHQYTSALMMAVRLNNPELIQETFDSCPDKNIRNQLCHILARQQSILESDENEPISIMSNLKLSHHFLHMGEQLDLMEAKTPADIYKVHLETHRNILAPGIDSAQQNLASSFVNGFVNAGFGNDKLILTAEDPDTWIHKNKDDAQLSATASLGLHLLWNTEEAIEKIDRYTFATSEYVKAGGLLALGISNNRIRVDGDPAFALLSENLTSPDHNIQTAAIIGLGLAYAGTNHPDVLDALCPLVTDYELGIDIAALAALSLGLTFVGTCNGDIASAIIQNLMEKEYEETNGTYYRFLGLALGLLYLGKQDLADPTCETLRAVEHSEALAIYHLVVGCAYAGTGNVERIQQLLHACIDHIDPKVDTDHHQIYSVLGVAMIAMGEDVGLEMSIRTFNHIMHYGESSVRKTVPLALGLLYASNPQLTILDTLSKFSHDNDVDVAVNAIFALGLVGAGTNNARIAQMLRQLATFYYKESSCLYMVRISQGLLHMGKGTISIQPFHTDRSILSNSALAGLLATIFAFTDSKNLVLGKAHYMLYYLVTAMYPRFLITVDEAGEPVEVTLRVGQAVDVVGQAGRPKTITGFQTHTTPVLLAYGERAELATDEYLALTPVLEGFVILKKNPDFVPEKSHQEKLA